MQDVAAIPNYIRISMGEYTTDVKVSIAGVDYSSSEIVMLKTQASLFKENPSIGACISSQIDLSLVKQYDDIPEAAEIKVYVRLISDTGIVSGWLQKGVYYVDTREKDDSNNLLTIHGFDSMLRAEMVYPSSSLAWGTNSPTAYAVVSEICGFMGISIENATKAIIQRNARIVGFPAQYTMKEVLESIAAMYTGNFIISPEGKLRLVEFNALPDETNYLITSYGDNITFADVRILLRSST